MMNIIKLIISKDLTNKKPSKGDTNTGYLLMKNKSKSKRREGKCGDVFDTSQCN